MDQWLAALNSLLAVKPKQGLLLTLFGGSTVLLHLYGVWPIAGIPDGWMIVAALVGLAGLVVLVVWACSALTERVTASVKSNAEIDRAKLLRDQRNQEAIENLELLNQSEQRGLAYILRAGQQRFAGDGGSFTLIALREKNLIYRDPRSSDINIHIVRPAIWEKRDSLLADFSSIPTDAAPPWTRW